MDLISSGHKLKINPFFFLDFNPNRPTVPNSDLEKSKWFRGIGNFIYRQNWEDPNYLFIALKAETHNARVFPTNFEHSHADGGHFVIFRYGKEYITDVGYQLGSGFTGAKPNSELNLFTRGSLGHNNMLFNGMHQTKLESRIIEALSEQDSFYVKMDLKESYGEDAGLKKYTREFYFTNDTLFIIDSFDGPEKFSNRFQVTKRTADSFSSFTRNDVSINGNRFSILPYGGGLPLYGQILYPDIEILKVDKIIGKEESTAKYIEQNGLGANYLINVLSFAEGEYSLSDQSSSFIIKGKHPFCYKKQAGACQGRKFGAIFLLN